MHRLIYYILIYSFGISSSQAQECESETCSSSSGSTHCHYDTSICTVPASIYGSGGSAVAYVPPNDLSPSTASVCNATHLSSNPYRVATWPGRRSTLSKRSSPHFSTVAPTVEIKIQLLACQSVSSSNACCCQNMHHAGEIILDLWQARPDGSYASLSAARQGSSECRARVIVAPQQSANIVVSTVAPGSTGSLYGLGPRGWDFLPYGPPVLHILVQPSQNGDTSLFHAPTLVDVPLVIQPHSLQPGRFYGSDLRGTAWMKSSKRQAPYKITSWQAMPKQNHISIDMEIYIPRQEASASAASAWYGITSSIAKIPLLPFHSREASRSQNQNEASLCPSFLYGWPHSFFLEPIAVCAPSMLDFFDL